MIADSLAHIFYHYIHYATWTMGIFDTRKNPCLGLRYLICLKQTVFLADSDRFCSAKRVVWKSCFIVSPINFSLNRSMDQGRRRESWYRPFQNWHIYIYIYVIRSSNELSNIIEGPCRRDYMGNFTRKSPGEILPSSRPCTICCSCTHDRLVHFQYTNLSDPQWLCQRECPFPIRQLHHETYETIENTEIQRFQKNRW